MKRKNRQIAKYPRIGRIEFMKNLEPVLSPRELEHVAAAYAFAKYGHRNQWRDSGRVRYFEHPKAVALILIDELGVYDWRAIVLALLHDTAEDSYVLSWERVKRNFGRYVVRGLKLVTKKPKRGYLHRLVLHGDPIVLMVKICDRLHNLRTLDSCSSKKQKKQITETLEKYIPLADLLIERLCPRERWRGQYLKMQLLALCKRYGKKFESGTGRRS